jgi:F-type H+-transporting ATPase subunit b
MREVVTVSFLLFAVLSTAPDVPGDSTATASEAGGAALASSEAPQAAHEQGAPLSFKADLALWSLVTFLVFIWVLRRFAWRPLIEGLDRRESRMRRDLADAEAARVKAQQLLAEHEEKLAKVHDEVREIVAEARRDAEQTKNEILTHAQREAEAARQRAVEDIEQARDDALQELFNVMADQVVAATTHVLGRSLTSEDQDRLIREALTEMAGSTGAR